MKDAFNDIVLIPPAGYEWIEARAPRKPKLGYAADAKTFGNPQPCLVAKGERGCFGEVMRQMVILSDHCFEDQKAVYIEFYRLHNFLYEKEKLMKEILKFANRYGSITEVDTFLLPPENGLVSVGAPLAYWEEEIYNFWNYFTLYQALFPTPNHRKLKECIQWKKNGVFYYYLVGKRDEEGMVIMPSYRKGGAELIAASSKVKFLDFVPGDVVKPAKYLVIKKIREYLRNTAGLDISLEGDLFIDFPGVLSFVWFQFAQVVGKTRRVIICPYCGQFLDTEGRRFKAHPECRNRAKKWNFNQRLEEAKKLYQGGKSFEEIASYFKENATKKLPNFSDPKWLRQKLEGGGKK